MRFLKSPLQLLKLEIRKSGPGEQIPQEIDHLWHLFSMEPNLYLLCLRLIGPPLEDVPARDEKWIPDEE
jgi:hypothetical protein